jgi:hypothetical protein
MFQRSSAPSTGADDELFRVVGSTPNLSSAEDSTDESLVLAIGTPSGR